MNDNENGDKKNKEDITKIHDLESFDHSGSEFDGEQIDELFEKTLTDYKIDVDVLNMAEDVLSEDFDISALDEDLSVMSLEKDPEGSEIDEVFDDAKIEETMHGINPDDIPVDLDDELPSFEKTSENDLEELQFQDISELHNDEDSEAGFIELVDEIDESPLDDNLENELTSINEISNFNNIELLPTSIQEETPRDRDFETVESLKKDPDIGRESTYDVEQLKSDLEKEISVHTPKHVEFENTPSVSLKISHIYGSSTQKEVMRILREFLTIEEDEENIWLRALERGQVLIPRISEYVSICIAHKLRKYPLEFAMGLSEEIFQSDVEEFQKGPVNSETMKLNKTFSYEKTKSKTKFDDIIITTTPQIENGHIINYIGLAFEEKTVNIADYHSNVIEIETSEGETSGVEKFGFKEIYRELSEKLKHHAFNRGGNGVINIQFQNIPIPNKENYYKISCSGTIVEAEFSK
ncbi:MAG: heavy metal-binding domain-containing protein [Halobacteriovoraceae bacterium]|nr:heavy metal-binding domain-containing protein [Halobacteriovoraceae bacterium]